MNEQPSQHQDIQPLQKEGEISLFSQRLKDIALHSEIEKLSSFLQIIAKQISDEYLQNTLQQLRLFLSEIKTLSSQVQNNDEFKNELHKKIQFFTEIQQLSMFDYLLKTEKFEDLDLADSHNILSSIKKEWVSKYKLFDADSIIQLIEKIREHKQQLSEMRRIIKRYEEVIEEETEEDECARAIHSKDMPRIKNTLLGYKKDVVESISQIAIQHSQDAREIELSVNLLVRDDDEGRKFLLSELDPDSIQIGEKLSVQGENEFHHFKPGQVIVHTHHEALDDDYHFSITPEDILKAIDNPPWVDPETGEEDPFLRIFGVVTVQRKRSLLNSSKRIVTGQFYLIDLKKIDLLISRIDMRPEDFGVNLLGSFSSEING